MDFLKACSTNVLQIPSLQSTRCTAFERPTDLQGSFDHPPHSTLAALRRHNVLCSASDSHLWIFGPKNFQTDEISEILRGRFVQQEEVAVEEYASKSGSFVIVEELLNAIELGLSFRLSQEHGFVRIGSWKWLYCPAVPEPSHESVLLHLHVKQLDSGCVQIATNARSVSTFPLLQDAVQAGSSVVLAPAGSVGTLLDESFEFSSGGAVKSRPASGVTARWKKRAMEALDSEGIALPHDMPWLLVRPTGSVSHGVLWPAHLCFLDEHQSGEDQVGSFQRWFGVSDSENLTDPLTLAEDWIKSVMDREDLYLAPQHESTASGTMHHDEISRPVATGVIETDMATSPPFLHRNDLHSVGGIYPTPPDGLAPSTSLIQSLNIESLPATQMQTDHSGLGNELFRNSEDTALEPRGRGPSVASSLGPQTYQHLSDDLFGDVDKDFGGGEVGDDDFNFFDDPDEVVPATGAQDAEMVDGTLDCLNENQFNVSAESTKDHAIDAVMIQSPSVNHRATVVDDQSQDSQGPEQEPDQANVRSEMGEISAFEHLPSSVPTGLEKPLSPFGIRERLLPPPIPASVVQRSQDPKNSSRQSSFGPVAFKDGLDIGSKFRLPLGEPEERAEYHDPGSGKANLARRKTPRSGLDDHAQTICYTHEEAQESDDEDDGPDDSLMGVSEEQTPLIPPWQNRKRKHAPSVERIASSDWEHNVNVNEEAMSDEDANAQLARLLQSDTFVDRGMKASARCNTSRQATSQFPSLESSFSEFYSDLIMIAQLVGEQAASCTETMSRDVATLSLGNLTSSGQQSVLQDLVTEALFDLIPGTTRCDLLVLALSRESIVRPSPNTPKGQPRPLPRSDSAPSGPEVFPIAAPYLSFRRADAVIEMLPPAMSFWEALTLGPINGRKDARAFCVLPESEHLSARTTDLMEDCKVAYESCKLGSFAAADLSSQVSSQATSQDQVELLWSIHVDQDASVLGILRAYVTTCREMGRKLATLAQSEPSRSFVIFILNPFPDPIGKHYMCACFWSLYKEYRDEMTKASQHQPASDLVLQILPIALLEPLDGVSVPDAARMAAIAREVYDRCPPANIPDNGSPLSIPSAPSVNLATTIPRRIGFQLNADAPTDLLHEGSVLHLAYEQSTDGQWIAVSWIDNTGRYQHNASFCLRGLSFADVAAEVWAQTLDVMAARQVSWRVFIATTANLHVSTSQCWRTMLTTHGPRRQPSNVTLVVVHPDPTLRLAPPVAANDSANPSAPGAGFLTPASTPQATNFTLSPDASGLANAPPTPAPSESTAENDPDAHLVDLPDESWGVLLDSKFNFSVPSEPPNAVSMLARGALVKHGEPTNPEQGHLPLLGVSIAWTVRVRPNGAGVDEGAARQAELTLKDLLTMYRGLGLLAKIRGLQRKGEEGVPLHVVTAMRGAEALVGFLSKDESTE